MSQPVNPSPLHIDTLAVRADLERILRERVLHAAPPLLRILPAPSITLSLMALPAFHCRLFFTSLAIPSKMSSTTLTTRAKGKMVFCEPHPLE